MLVYPCPPLPCRKRCHSLYNRPVMRRAKNLGFKYEVFISYSSREPELQELLPLIERFRYDVREHLVKHYLEDVVFFDRYTWGPVQARTDDELSEGLRREVEASVCMFCFVSPAYLYSKWCDLEHETMQRHEHSDCRCICGGLTLLVPVIWKDIGGRLNRFEDRIQLDIRDCLVPAVNWRDAWDHQKFACWFDFVEKSAKFVLARLSRPRCEIWEGAG
jgi:TIR domain